MPGNPELLLLIGESIASKMSLGSVYGVVAKGVAALHSKKNIDNL